MSLTLLTIPGFTEIPDTAFNAGGVASDTVMKELNAAAKFATVRNEFFVGFYRIGETVQIPTSPADGYVYSRSELIYIGMPYYSAGSTSALNGTTVPPAKGSTSGPGTLLEFGWYIDQATGAVSGGVDYFGGGTQTNTTDGIVFVLTIAQRQH
jgi:hypothetical protein